MRLAVVGIVVEGDKSISIKLQEILTEFGDMIVGRMGVPDKELGCSVISLIVKAEMDRITALCGKIGKLDGVTVKSAVTSVKI